MRLLPDFLTDLRRSPFGAWLGLSQRCSYELTGSLITKRTGESVTRLAPVDDITSWRSLGRREVAIRLPYHTVILCDQSGALRAILENVAKDREHIDAQ